MANKEMRTIQFPDSADVFEVVDSKARQNIVNLGLDKLDVATYATGAKGLQQIDALTILNAYDNYESKLILFYANETAPDKLISIGWVVKSLVEPFEPSLIEIDREGHTIRWTKETNYNVNDSIRYKEI